MLIGAEAVGCITLFRREVRAFSPDEIALVETFAAQAVIAIENVRQFQALQARTEEVQALNASLEARVEAQVGEIERMGRLKRFLPAAVADAVISSGSEKMLSSHRALLGILFCDMRGFTAFCETAEPEETSPRDLDRLPTRGSVSNAFAVFPKGYWQPLSGLTVYGGVLMAFGPAAPADPRNTRLAGGDPRNALGGDPTALLGTEFDLGLRYEVKVWQLDLAAGLELGYLLPGGALVDAMGDDMNGVSGGRLLVRVAF